jgi:hypothetical protein
MYFSVPRFLLEKKKQVKKRMRTIVERNRCKRVLHQIFFRQKQGKE